MSAPLRLLYSPAAQALALSLAHFLWQGALVALLLAAALAALRRARPGARYALSLSAMALMALSPPLTFAAVYRGAPPALLSAAAGALPEPSRGPALLAALLLAWWLGASAMAARLLGGWLRVGRLIREASAPREAWLSAALAALCEKLGVRRPPRLLESAGVTAPALAGFFRPAILLPLSLAARLPAPTLEAILAHELAHLRRHDYALNLAQSLVEALLFYHPAVWWVGRKIREEREYCCDDAAAALSPSRLAYARALAALESLRAEAPPLGAASTGGSLMKRISRLVAPPPAPKRRGAPLLAAGLLGAAALAACAAALSPGEAERQAALAIPWLPEEIAQWTPHFREAAARHGLDPEVLAIVTMVESGGDPEAVSAYGALGLMQVMPGTAERIARERGLADYAAEKLRDPAYNIDFGAWYLAKQLKDFGGADADSAVELAAAAYNAGPKRLRKHLDEGAPLPEETEKYKALISALWKERRDPASAAFEYWSTHHRFPEKAE